MDPLQQENRIIELEKQVKNLTDILSSIMQNSNATKIYFKNQVQFDAQCLIGFFGKDAIKKPAAITAPSGGATVDSQSRTAISTIITTLQSLGLIS